MANYQSLRWFWKPLELAEDVICEGSLGTLPADFTVWLTPAQINAQVLHAVQEFAELVSQRAAFIVSFFQLLPVRLSFLRMLYFNFQ